MICGATERHLRTAVWVCRLMVMWKQKASTLVCVNLWRLLSVIRGKTLSWPQLSLMQTRKWGTFNESICQSVCPGHLVNEIPQSWKVCFLKGITLIWQQQQHVLLFYTWITFFSFLPEQCKIFWTRKYVSIIRNCQCFQHLPPFQCFVSCSPLCLHTVFFVLFFFYWFKSQLFCHPSLREILVLVHQLYKIIQATSVQAGVYFKPTKV